MPMRRMVLALAAVCALAGMNACGGNSDEGKVTDAIVTSATTSDPANCTELLTQSFVEQTEFEKGEQALKSCREQDQSSNADSVEVRQIEVDGESATAEARIEGSVFDGQTLAISLVSEDGQWKLDRIEDITIFDKEALAEAFARTATQGEDPLTQEQADCVAENFRTGPPGTIEQAILSGDPEALAPAFQGCL